MIRVVLLGCLVALQVSCTQNAPFTTARWVGQGEMPPTPPGVESQKGLQTIGEKGLVLQFQKIEDVEVEGSYYKKISDKGQAELIDYRWMSKVPLSVRRDLILMRAQKAFVLRSFLKAHEAFSPSDLYRGPELVVRADDIDGVADVFWKLIFEEKDGTLQAYYLNKDFLVVIQKRLGSEFIDATANLFPNGPLKSDLQEVLLRGLLSNKELSSSAIKITTEADQIALPGEKNELNFTVNDIRFSQVQVFFYLSEALSWFEKNLSFRLPFVLEAETQKGYPEKTNTAFYFQQRIRLGEGDGEVFDRIPMDPSIVTHESLHAVIESVAGLPYDKQGGSLNEAFADFFTAVQLANPKMGETSYKKAPFKRTIENDLKLQDVNDKLYHDSGIVSGLLWGMYKKLGNQSGISVAWKTLLRLNPYSDFMGFKQELIAVIEQESPDVQKKAMAELKDRGWLQ
ncbi:MAG: hypothetical protein IPM97_11475 [Bdellovibrionaceae bacterium]|nr:hypothetical protein [Pseudobdellovibrionaceae bacterium]